ncbi:MAG: Holliday junction resolvase RuvX [Candidatus Coatesbacteria bacterium]
MRVLAIDFGTRRIGVAVSDETATLARPLAVLPAVPRDRLLRELARLVTEHAAGEVVVGRPRGSRGPGTLEAAAEAFAGELREACGVPVHLRDESMTTAVAQEKLLEAGARRRKRRASLDAAAAAVLLQAWLDDRKAAR